MVNSEGGLVRTEADKISYVPIARWGSKAARDAFSDAAIAAIRNAGHHLDAGEPA